MSLDKLPPTTEGTTAALGGLPKAETSPKLKESAGKISNFTTELLMNQLKELDNNNALEPDDADVQLAYISKRISELPNVPKKLQELQKSTFYNFVFPVRQELYERN